MKEYTIDYEGGNFLREVFYQLTVESDGVAEMKEVQYKNAPDRPYIIRRPIDAPGFKRNGESWIELFGSKSKVFGDCQLNPQHYTRTIRYNLVKSELFYCPDLADFTNDSYGFINILPNLKEKLDKQPFKGAIYEPFECWSQSVDDKIFNFYALQGAGKVLQHWPVRFKDGKNECPYCGKGPLICPSCGASSGSNFENRLSPSVCEYCQKVIYYDPDKPEQFQGIKCTNFNQNYGPMLQGKSWDGQDFVQFYSYLLISRRVLDFLLKEKAAPFCAIPCRFFTDGMTDKQMEQLKVVTNGRLK